ncbi:MAG TPA: zf-HC2 domain-containing protein [Thermomicrobiaceae bacterium]|nr:zf-HC2 domain-containing protein [Thermomicrobiaceae bacterium]
MSDASLSSDWLTCREFVEIVTDYLEGSLPASERERFEAHLAVCPGCQIYLEQIRETVRLSGRLTEDSISPEAQSELLRAFRDWKQAG